MPPFTPIILCLLCKGPTESLLPLPTLRFPPPLIKPNVSISGIRLSDWSHREAHGTNPSACDFGTVTFAKMKHAKKKGRLAAVSPKPNRMFGSGGCALGLFDLQVASDSIEHGHLSLLDRCNSIVDG